MDTLIDWGELAGRIGALTDQGERGGTQVARDALAQLLGPEQLSLAVEHYVTLQPGCETARSVLSFLRHPAAMEACYRVYREDADLEHRRSAVELLRVVCDARALPWIEELLEDPDDGVRVWAVGALDQLVYRGLVDGHEDEVRRLLGRACADESPTVVERGREVLAALEESASSDEDSPVVDGTATALVHGFLRAKREKNARNLLLELGSRLGLDVSEASVERYYKDPAQFRFAAEVTLGDLSLREAYFEVPRRLHAVASAKIGITTPVDSGPGWDFDVDVSRTSIAGVESVAVAVRGSSAAGTNERSTLRAIGFWYDGNRGEPPLPDPRDFVDPDWDAEERRLVVDYLKDGKRCAYCMGYSSCRLCGELNGSADYRDDRYLWPEGLAHYVEEHCVRLPDEFVQHVLRPAPRPAISLGGRDKSRRARVAYVAAGESSSPRAPRSASKR